MAAVSGRRRSNALPFVVVVRQGVSTRLRPRPVVQVVFAEPAFEPETGLLQPPVGGGILTAATGVEPVQPDGLEGGPGENASNASG
jgi:hypothetical protein